MTASVWRSTAGLLLGVIKKTKSGRASSIRSDAIFISCDDDDDDDDDDNDDDDVT